MVGPLPTTTPAPEDKPLTPAQLIEFGSVDREFFCSTFFPQTARQKMPAFHHSIWDLLESSSRLVMIHVFRGGAKTSTLRMYSAKRIAYGLARTVLIIGKSEAHALASARWLRKRIEAQNSLFAQTFQLSPGTKWQDHHFEILHGLQTAIRGEPFTITVLAMGATGSTRGVNIDDWRPDLIILDDIVDAENASTPEQRKKVSENVYGALKPSLAPAVDAPDAKMVGLQTPLDREDYSCLAFKDPEWISLRIGCWTRDTESRMIEQLESVWPERYPTEELRRMKRAYIARNQLSLWTREYECKIVTPETSAFIASWLQIYDVAPPGLIVFSGIDPVPPPSERAIAKGLAGNDYEAIASVGRLKNDFYLLDYDLQRGHDPGWTIATFFKHGIKYRPRRWIVEAIAYQRTLAWILRQAMNSQKHWFVVKEFTDQRSKYNLILDGVSGIASNRHLFIKREHADFIQQFSDYPNTSHDDLLNIVAILLMEMNDTAVAGDEDDFEDGDSDKGFKSIEYNPELMAP